MPYKNVVLDRVSDAESLRWYMLQVVRHQPKRVCAGPSSTWAFLHQAETEQDRDLGSTGSGSVCLDECLVMLAAHSQHG